MSLLKSVGLFIRDVNEKAVIDAFKKVKSHFEAQSIRYKTHRTAGLSAGYCGIIINNKLIREHIKSQPKIEDAYFFTLAMLFGFSIQVLKKNDISEDIIELLLDSHLEIVDKYIENEEVNSDFNGQVELVKKFSIYEPGEFFGRVDSMVSKLSIDNKAKAMAMYESMINDSDKCMENFFS